jgi:hypothetical protein
MTIASIRIQRRALPKQPDLRDPKVLRDLHERAEREAQREEVRRSLRRFRSRVTG